MYKFLLLPVLALASSWGADDRFLALTLRAQTDFGRVEASPFPDLQATARCAQSQAEVLPVSTPAEVPLVLLRKGYCALLHATVTGSRADYGAAARDFARAMAAWETRVPEPLPSGLQVLSAVARIRSGAEDGVLPDIRAGFEDAVQRSACPASAMPEWQCAQLLSAANLWLGWMAEREGNLPLAAAWFKEFTSSGWDAWVAGRQALAAGRYADAVCGFDRAVAAWRDTERYPKPGLERLLGPQPDLAGALYRLGAAQYLAGQHAGAASTLGAALKARPENAHALFVRGLARAAMGQPEAALADYQLAARTAFAYPEEPHAGARAHYYRGVWQFRRGDFARAEDEFAAALNQDPGGDVRDDVLAWRHMTAVAGGACEASAPRLEAALARVSAFFPRAEAEKLADRCRGLPAHITHKRP